MRKSLHLGFSLIELMIVVAIIGILSTIAIPSYQNYALRARFSEVIAATEPYKTAISLALQQGIPITELSNNTHGIPTEPISSKNLQTIKVDHGIITATATKVASNTTYVLKPKTDDGSTWEVDISSTCLKAGLCES